ncbi:MAG: hypothetical protein KF869_14080 [Phycisphaeraceae bacterium]|nr:hypothetical protein [Phycisphaeraceae bacterium]
MYREAVGRLSACVVVVCGAWAGGCRSDESASSGGAALNGATARRHQLPIPEERARVRSNPHAAPADPRPPASGPLESWLWQKKRLADENGVIPVDGWEIGRKQLAENEGWWREQNAGAQGDGPAARGAGLSPASWVSRGPGNVGGRTRSFLIHPTTPLRMWAGGVSGGVWYTANGGTTWTPVADAMSNLNIGCLAFDPTNSDVIFAGTGEGVFGGGSLAGNGIWKSVDAGVTWTQMSGTASWGAVGRIAVNPANTQIILAARSGSSAGIMRTTNGGATWSNVAMGSESQFVSWDPNDSAKAVAHVRALSGAHRAMYSTNSGQTWTAATGIPTTDRIELCYAAATPNMVYALSGNGLVYRSTDGGQTYTVRTTSGNAGSSWWACPIWVSPTNSDLLTVGGYAIYRSTNGGQTLTQISNGYIITTAPHPDIHWFMHDPGYNGTTNRRWWVATDGGLHGTNDIHASTISWFSRQATYRTTQFYGAAGHGPTGRIIGGTQDNGTLRLNSTSSDTANLTFGGDGGFCAIDHEDPNYTYGEYIYAQVHRSTNGGQSASYITNGLSDANAAANFIAPFILDPNNPNTMYVGASSLWRSQNVRTTASWSAVRAPGNDYISAIAVAPGNSSVVWVGQNNGQVWRTTNAHVAAPTWTVIDNNGTANPLPNRYVTRIYFDPGNASIVYVAFGGFATNNLYRSTNGGTTWSDITGSGASGLPNIPIYGIARHPTVANWLYVATELGVFSSNDGGATWSTASEGPRNVRTDEIVFMHASNRLLAATHGRGIYTADINPCAADFDANGTRDVNDIFAFLGAWFANDPSANFDGVGGVGVDDIFAFLSAWFAGCP